MKGRIAGVVFFLLFIATFAWIVAQCSAPVSSGDAAEATPTPHRTYLPSVRRGRLLEPDPAPGDWRWRVVLGDWDQNEEAAIAWAEGNLPGDMELETAYWPDCSVTPCRLYWRLIVGRWETIKEAKEWAVASLPSGMSWETGYFYNP